MNNKGVSLVEVVLALAVVSVAVTVFIGGILYGSDTVISRSFRLQARWYASECIHVARWIRTVDGLDALTAGNHGLIVSGGRWVLSGTEDIQASFERTLFVTEVSEHEVEVACSVTWQSQFGDREVVLESRIAEWNE